MASTIDRTEPGTERRSEERTAPETYHSAEFRLHSSGCLFQTRIWNLSAKGMCLLLKEDSEVLADLAVGKILEVNYHPQDSSRPAQVRRTQVAHVTKETQGRFKNHVLIGLRIVDKTQDG